MVAMPRVEAVGQVELAAEQGDDIQHVVALAFGYGAAKQQVLCIRFIGHRGCPVKTIGRHEILLPVV